jgi:hypothetical protein
LFVVIFVWKKINEWIQRTIYLYCL